ncbi:MAG: phosphoribosylanthranilate isomerase [Alphaproteobacteria bacterium]|nr:phosphoribosylanthranilate isomerase [Alphaproteobacteria bacterium]
MTVGVKICGINDPAAFDAAVEAGADWLGFVFFPRSPRYITPERAADLSARATGGPARVGLFVDPTDAAIETVLGLVRLDALQLYVDTARAREVRSRYGVPVWHAVGIASPADLPTDVEGIDRLVLEAKPPQMASRPGGNATRFDWSLLHDWRAPAPWILAGGLDPDNVLAAIQATGAAAVDVSSGVESAPGVKDPGLIRSFVATARRA